MKYQRMTSWALLLTLAAALFTGCTGYQNPTVPPQSSEITPAASGPSEPAHAPQLSETLPPQTEAPTEPTEPEPVLLELSPEARRELNSFLSSFSEQWFLEELLWDDDPANDVFYADTGSTEQIVEFVWLFAKLNLNEELEVVTHGDDDYYGFSLSILNPVAERFLGQTLTGEALAAMESEHYLLLDAMVCGPAADGESYTNMTVTEELYDLGDGTLRAEFAIYDTWAFIVGGGSASGKDLYSLTGEQARTDPDLQLHLKGAAVVRPQTLENGRESYQLVSYELYEPAA